MFRLHFIFVEERQKPSCQTTTPRELASERGREGDCKAFACIRFDDEEEERQRWGTSHLSSAAHDDERHQQIPPTTDRRIVSLKLSPGRSNTTTPPPIGYGAVFRSLEVSGSGWDGPRARAGGGGSCVANVYGGRDAKGGRRKDPKKLRANAGGYHVIRHNVGDNGTPPPPIEPTVQATCLGNPLGLGVGYILRRWKGWLIVLQ